MAESAHHLPERDRVVRQRVYITIRILDVYVSTFLGLPCSLRAIGIPSETPYAPYIGHPEMLLATDANVQLLQILGTAVEESYFTNYNTTTSGSHVVRYASISDAGRKLDEWARTYPAFAQVNVDSQPATIRSGRIPTS